MPNSPFSDPREPWITTGILVSLASLFDLCKGIRVRFEGNGDYKAQKGVPGSVPGRKAVPIASDSEGRLFVADSEFFEACIEDIRDSNLELSQSVGLLRDFKGKISVPNLVSKFVYWQRNQEVASAIHDASIGDTIGDFTFDFQELGELSGLLLVSFRNRKSHRKLHEGSDRAFVAYHHALMSRFQQLVDNCLEYTQSRGWCTKGPMENEQGDSLPMIHGHIEGFKSLAQVVFEGIGPPLHLEPNDTDAVYGSAQPVQQASGQSGNDITGSISKADFYDLADAIREAHDESASYVAWLEERLSSAVASTAEDLKNSLLEPWKNKNIETLLNLVASKLPAGIPHSDSNYASPCVEGATAADQGARLQEREELDTQITTSSRRSLFENGTQEIRSELRDLCKEMRNRLNQINPRFEFYHCVLQSPIVVPAIQRGVCSYEQLKQTEEFQSRIVIGGRSFMLDEQENMYKERIDQILSRNHF